MQFTIAAIIAAAAAAGLVGAAPQPRQSCSEATQFGVLSLSPTTVAPGEILSVNADFSCAINYFHNIPEFTDYYITVPVNNNGHEPPILLSRSAFNGNTSNSLSVVVPIAYYFANTSYAVTLATTYPVNGPNGMLYSVVGSVDAPITINV
ncbi:hypothetical protein OG21DRAFT_1292705 [Imleria badia]|nr:hypothetical protein OG21DRAFT_1292705 [Imleria badia]